MTPHNANTGLLTIVPLNHLLRKNKYELLTATYVFNKENVSSDKTLYHLKVKDNEAIMIQELPVRNPPVSPMRFKRYFESKNNKIRIFGQCEITGKNFEIHVPVEGFFVYLQGFKNIAEALTSSSEEEREFILTGISPQGRRTREQRL